jgi:DNA-binding NtrC family response regulator
MEVHSIRKSSVNNKFFKEKKTPSKIVIVDDDKDFLLALKFLLKMKQMNIDCKTFNKVQYALNYIIKSEKRKEILGGSIDLIISDYNMYPNNGLDFFREICKMDLKIPFVLMSGFLSENIIREALSLGIVECLRKDEDISDSIVKISKHLKKVKTAF